MKKPVPIDPRFRDPAFRAAFNAAPAAAVLDTIRQLAQSGQPAAAAAGAAFEAMATRPVR